MRTVCTALALVATLMIANTVSAAGDKKASKIVGIRYYKTIDQNLSPVTLTDDQKSKLETLKKDYESKFQDAYTKQDVLTPEQKKLADEAKKAAKAEGKSRKEVKAAVDEAVKKTDEQKAQEKEAGKALRALEKEMRGKVLDLLTQEQKDQVKSSKSKKGDKPAKPAKPAEADATPATPATK